MACFPKLIHRQMKLAIDVPVRSLINRCINEIQVRGALHPTNSPITLVLFFLINQLELFPALAGQSVG